jgi:hypothetical protein
VSACYYAHAASLEPSGDVVSILLSPAGERRPPGGAHAFWEDVLVRVGASARLVTWGVETFVTPYFGADWSEAFQARLLVEAGATLPARARERVAIELAPETFAEAPRLLPVRVLADFDGRHDADSALEQLRREEDGAGADALRHDRHEIREVAARFQLAVDVGTIERDGGEPPRAAVERVLRACRDHGGRTEAG